VYTRKFAKNLQENLMKKRLKGLRVAVAEDNHIGQVYIKGLLEYYGCEVDLAEDGNKLLELVRHKDLHCIIMDKNMPEMDGVETTKQIRRMEIIAKQNIPIIGLTAAAIEGDRDKLLEAGVDYFLSKPIKQNELLEILEKISESIIKKENETEIISEVRTETGTEINTDIDILNMPGFNEKTDQHRINTSNKPEYDVLNLENNYKNVKIINYEVFKEEASLFGITLMQQIAEEFLNEYNDKLNDIFDSIEKCDYKNLQKKIHKFASSVSPFHAEELYNFIKEIEKKLSLGDKSTVIEDYHKLVCMVKKLAEELTEILHQKHE